MSLSVRRALVLALAAAFTALAQHSHATDRQAFPQFDWTPSLPLRFGDPAVTPIGGTELRALAVFDHKLFAGVGYWMDTESKNPALPGAQVLRLDAANGQWQVDLELTERDPWQVKLRKDFAISIIKPVRFAYDQQGHALESPVDMLVAGVWSHNLGLDVFVRKAGAASWSSIPIPGQEAVSHTHIRAFHIHRDRKTGAEKLFASGSNAIFAGSYDSERQGIVWDQAPDWSGSDVRSGGRARVMSLAECGDKLYATQNGAIYERADGPTPVWTKIFETEIKSTHPTISGLRGLTCVGHPSGRGESLLVAAEDEPARIYRVDLTPSEDGRKETLELDVSAFLSAALVTKATYAFAAYNDMTPYPASAPGCPQYLIGLEARTPDANETFGKYHYHPFAHFLVRACDGTYSLHEIVDPRIVPKPWLGAVRTFVLSPFASDPPGTVYAGGFDTHFTPVHNTAWLYKGVPVGNR